MAINVDDSGIPIYGDSDGRPAPEAPENPCKLWEWCKTQNTCAATIDWDKICGNY